MSARTVPLAAEAAAAPRASAARSLRLVALAGFAVAHIVLALVMQRVPVVATVHAIACLIVGVIVAARRRIQDVAYVVAYIAGSEVLWRMTQAGVFWEYGKYAISAVMLVALFRIRSRRNRGLAITYLIVLLPSVLLTLFALNFDLARQVISFNLSGPLCLTLCVLVFSNVRLDDSDLRTTMLALIAPVIGIATIAYYSTATAVDLEFVGESNSVTSGGFGPNQVSSMLGLALLFALLLVLDRRVSLAPRVALLGLAVALATQAALTFSRSGLALALAGAFAAIFYLVRDARTRVTLVVLAALLFSVGKYAVVPWLEEFTAGKLSERYTSIDPTGRGLMAGFDLQIFADNPALGVGPGVASGLREELGHGGAAHTEFTRLLAEHGVLGILAIALLVALGIRTFVAARGLRARAYVIAMLVWVALFLLVNAMRVAAPSFLVGLACSVTYASLAAAPATRAARRGAGEAMIAPAFGLLYVGNFLTGSHNRSYCFDLASRLEHHGWRVTRTSSQAARAARLFDMLRTAWTRRQSYDVVVIDVFSGAAFVWAEAVCFELRRLGKPYVLALHGGRLPEFGERWPRRVRRLFGSASAVTAPSEFLSVRMRGYRDDIAVVPNAVDAGAFCFAVRTAARPRLVWVRAFHAIYNPCLAVDVLASLSRRFPEATLTMIGPDKGDGSLDAVRARAGALGIADRVATIGRLTHAEIAQHLAEADVFVNTTDVDNTPVSVLQAMSCGLCVVTTAVGGMPYLVENERSALLVPPRDPEAMALAVERVLVDPTLAERISRGARERASQHDWGPVLDQWTRTLIAAVAHG